MFCWHGLSGEIPEKMSKRGLLADLIKINFGVVADVETQMHAPDTGIATDDRVFQNGFLQSGKIAYNTVLDDGLAYANIVADGDMWTNNTVANVAVIAHRNRMYEDGVLKIRQVRRFRVFPVALIQQHGICLE